MLPERLGIYHTLYPLEGVPGEERQLVIGGWQLAVNVGGQLTTCTF